MATRSSSAYSGGEQLKYPHWQGLYHAAVLETNRHKIVKCIQAAESAMLKRLQALPEISDNITERRAIFDGLGTLRFLKLDAERKPPTSVRKLA